MEISKSGKRIGWIEFASFFLGSKQGIELVASSSKTFWLGCLFIVSAGLARNYDHHLLLEEPLWLIGPFFMAFFSATLIHGIVCKMCKLTAPEIGSKLLRYKAWLRCFLLTAPLAWLYGIPYESYMDVLSATKFNFATLIVVSLWRVYLMSRVLCVLYNMKALLAVCAILLPASLEMLVASYFKGVNIVGIMGGMRLSPSDQFLLSATNFVSVASLVLFVASLIMYLILLERKRVKVHTLQLMSDSRISSAVYALCSVSIGIWFFIGLDAQNSLNNKRELLALMREQKFDEVVSFLDGKKESDFPEGHLIFGSRYRWAGRGQIGLLAKHEELDPWVVDRVSENVRYALKDQKLDEETISEYGYILDELGIQYKRSKEE